MNTIESKIRCTQGVGKKGVELSLNVLIIAILGLLVMFVLAAVFLGKFDFGKKVGDCVVQGGKCAEECGSVDFGTENMRQNVIATCTEKAGVKQICCIPLST